MAGMGISPTWRPATWEPRGVAEARAWPRWGQLLLLGLSWQVLGLLVTLALAFPVEGFHLLVHRVMLGATVTNGIALLGGGFLVFYWRRLHRRLARRAARVAVILGGLTPAVAASVFGAFETGRYFCRLDGYEVDRWHLSVVTTNAMVLVSVGLACGLVFAHERLSARLAREVRETERLERVQLETQLAALQAKVNPHFLFNTLNTLVDLVRSDPERVERLVLSLSDIYRRVLALPEAAGVPLGEEIELVEHYLSIEKVRMGTRLRYSIDVPADLRRAIVPPLAVEILAENAVRHGLAPRREGGSIAISARRGEGQLRVEVVDDGVGLGEPVKGTGFGLLSIRQRLDLLYEKGEGRLEVTPAPGGGTRAVLKVPDGD